MTFDDQLAVHDSLHATTDGFSSHLPAPNDISWPYSGLNGTQLRLPSSLGMFGGFPAPCDGLSKRQKHDARQLDLLIAPANPAAETLVDAVLAAILGREESSERRKRRRRDDVARQLRDAVGAIIGNVLAAWAGTPPMPVYRSMRGNGLTGEIVGARTFRSLVKDMTTMLFLMKTRGGHAKAKNVGQAARFYPGPRLLLLAAEHGVDRETVREDFRRRRYAGSSKKVPDVRAPLRLKAIPAHPNAKGSTRLEIDEANEIAALLCYQVEDLNAFARTVEVTGCAPPRWFRLFFDDFRLYGRMHAVGGGNYQGMSAAARLSDIRIAGEPVVEIDIRSSLLTFMHGLLDLPLPAGDLYELPGVPRAVAKLCINATLGKGTPVRSWAKAALEKHPILAGYPARDVMAAALARYPFLAEPWRIAEPLASLTAPRRAVIHMLMRMESQVIVEVMAALRAKMILALPMHDGLIVPATAEALTCELIHGAGRRIAGVDLRLKVDRPEVAQAKAMPIAGQVMQ